MEKIADHFKGWNALETIHTGETWNGWRSVNLTWDLLHPRLQSPSPLLQLGPN